MNNDRLVAEAITSKLADVAALRDPTLADHLRRTAELACAIGAEMGLDVDSLDTLYTAGLLHDIGKLGISEAILWKPSGLTRSEWQVVRGHPEAGHRLIADVMQQDIAAAVLSHHERIDGDGYPRGLPGRSLPLVARIVQVADAFDAMTSRRPYRPALETPLAVVEVLRCAGTQFDGDVARALAALLDGHRDGRPKRWADYGPPQDRGFAAAAGPSLVRLRDRSA